MSRATLRVALLAVLAQPVYVFLATTRPLVARPAALAATPLLRARPLIAQEDSSDAYRTLGISEDAAYDEITTAYDNLSEQYAGDAAYIAKLDAAKDKVVNAMLSRRLSGAAAQYEGGLALEDRKVPPPTPIWEKANNLRKKTILRPSPRYALQVFALLGGMALACWVAPSTAQTSGLLATASGMGFMYNRGEAEAVRDDFGQIGEIKPMKPKPFALTVSITALVWLLASIRTSQMMAVLPQKPPKGLVMIVRTTLVSLGLIIPALFVRVHGFFDD